MPEPVYLTFRRYSHQIDITKYHYGKSKIKQVHDNECITLQKCDPALARSAAVHWSSDGAGGLDLLHGGEHGDSEHGDGGDEQHRDERQLNQGLPNAD